MPSTCELAPVGMFKQAEQLSVSPCFLVKCSQRRTRQKGAFSALESVRQILDKLYIMPVVRPPVRIYDERLKLLQFLLG
jgi:hypothetical protein